MEKLSREQMDEFSKALKEAGKAYSKQPPYLLIVFILLKAFNVIQWSWFATIAFPIALPFMIVFGVIIIIAIVFGLILLGAISLDTIGRFKRKFRK